MSRIYDNWERLVAATIKRQQIWQLCHAHSRSSSFSSDLSSQIDQEESAKSTDSGELVVDASEIENESTQKYEPGVYFTFVQLRDGARYITRARFSRKKFNEQEAEAWWAENKEKVDARYNLQPRNIRVIGHQEPVVVDASEIVNESMEKYESGVYITFVDRRGGIRSITRARFSRKLFITEQKAEEWWSENKGKVYERYNLQPGSALVVRSQVTDQTAAPVKELFP